MGKMTSVSCIPQEKTVHNCGLVLLHLSIMVSSKHRNHVEGHKKFRSVVCEPNSTGAWRKMSESGLLYYCRTKSYWDFPSQSCSAVKLREALGSSAFFLERDFVTGS